MNTENEQNYLRSNEKGLSDKFNAFLGSSIRATKRFFKYLPWRIGNLVKRRINDYKHRPARTDINKVYVLVGYTTRKHVDEKYNAERHMIVLRRGLLALIFILLLFISVNKVLEVTNFDEIKQMFGIGSWSEVTQNDPFKSSSTDVTENTALIKVASPTPNPAN